MPSPSAPTAAPDVAVSPSVSTTSSSRQWFPLIGLVCLLMAATRATLIPVSDPDTWWHLRLGHEFSGPWSLTDPGQLSPFATRPWFATQWIPELVASRFEASFGLPGVAWLFSATVIALVVTVFMICRRETDALPSVLAAGVCFIGTSASLSPRPQIVSFLLLAVVSAAWLRTTRDLRARWWLIPVTWFWACSHGMWFTGVVAGAAVILGLALDKRLDRQTFLRLSSIPLLSVLAAALTPVGPKLLLAPIATSGMAPFVSEWAAPSFREPYAAVTMLMISVVVISWSRRGEVPWAQLSILLVATAWTLLSARTVALGAVMMAPLLAAAMQTWLPVRPKPRSRRAEILTLSAGVAAALTMVTLTVPSSAATPAKVPEALNDELRELPAGTTVLNAYELGGWLTWRHADLAPVIDGMTDAYTVDHMVDYVSTLSVSKGWRDFLADTDASHAVLEQGSPLATALVERLRWVRVDTDEGYVLLQAHTR